MTPETRSPEERAKQVWLLRSDADIAPNVLSMAAHLVETTAVGSGDRVLDIGCGTGNVAMEYRLTTVTVG